MMNKGNKEWIGFLLGLGATVLWASYYPAARFIFGTAEQSDPLLLSIIRMGFTVLFFLPFIVFSKKRRSLLPELLKTEWKILAFLAFSGVVVQGVLVFISLKYTTAARGALMANMAPIFTVIFAWLFLKESISAKMWSGMIIGFAGIALSMVSSAKDIFLNNSASTLFGDLLALLSGVAWALYTVAGVRIVRERDSMTVTMLTFAMGFLMMPPVMLIFGSPFDLSTMTPRLWIGMLYMGIFTGGLAFWAWLAALRFTSSSKLGSFGYLSALLAALSSMLLLKESLSLLFLISVVMALGGVALMMQKQTK